jgi:hypothetical protein
LNFEHVLRKADPILKRLLLALLLTILLSVALAALTLSGAATGLAGTPLSGLPIWGTDIKVNPTEVPPPFRSVQRNFEMAVNPANPQMLLTGYDNLRKTTNRSVYSVSTDSGLTWTSGGFDTLWDGDNQPLGDVSVAFDRQGQAYISSFAQGSNTNGYYVLTSTNGLNWSTPVPIISTDNSNFRYRARMLVDNSPTSPYSGRLYFFYHLNLPSPPFFHGVKMHYSTDRGSTWSALRSVTDPQYEYSTYGVSASIAPDGTVYAAYVHIENDVFLTGPYRFYIDKSTDGGVSWSTDRLITGAPMVQIGRPDFKGGRELVLVTDDKCSIMRIFNHPFIATSPQDPNIVYTVWNDGRWDSPFTLCGDSGRHSDIAFSRSTDGGVTWSTPIRINDDAQGNGIDQFQPTIAVRPDGLIGVTWLDRRHDPPDYYHYDLFYSQSTDGGLTWSQNQRVSDVSNDPNPVVDYKSVDDLGYKNSLVFTPNYVIAGWIRTLLGTFNSDYHIDRGLMKLTTPTPVNTALPTSTRTPTTPPQATATGTSALPTATACTLTFTDVDTSNPFYHNIRCLACRGIISGYADGTFRPGADITRGQISKMVSNAAGFSEPVSGQTFEDVPPTSTFWEWIERLTARGVMSGYACGGAGEPCVPPLNRPYFRPGQNATRGQLSKIVSNAAQIQDPVSGQFYEDVPPSHTFYVEIMRLTGRGVMSGYACGGVGEPCVPPDNRPYFRPGNNVTRGQASKIVANTFFPSCVTP